MGELERELEDDSRKTSTTPQFEVAFDIPVFDSGMARKRASEITYMRAANQLAERAVNIRSEARSAYLDYTASHQIARHYRDAVLPLRRTIEEEGLLSYNGMITNTFELLADTQDRLNSNLMEASARRDFWLADANLVTAIYGGAPPPLPEAKVRKRRRSRRRRTLIRRSNAMNRRQLLGAGAVLVSTSAWGQTRNMGLPEAALMDTPATQPLSALIQDQITPPSSP